MNIAIDVTFLIQDKRGMGRYARDVISSLLELSGNFYFLSSRNLKDDLKKEFKSGNWEFINYKNKKDIEFIDVVWHPWNRIDLLGAKKNVVNIHDTLPFKDFADNIPVKYIKKDRQRLLDAEKLSDAVIALSEFSKNETVNDLKSDNAKIKVIPPGVCGIFEKKVYSDEEKNRLLIGYSQGFPFILYVGSSDKRKNWINLLKAFAFLKEKYAVKHKLLIAGKKPDKPGIFSKDTEKKEILSILDYLIIKGEAYLIEEINDIDLVNLYNLADLFVFPSLYEGFGLPVLEAQACGAPVTASNKSSIPEALGEGGLLFDPYDHIDMAEKMYKVISDGGLRENLIKKGSDNVKKYSYKKCAQEMMELLCQNIKR